MSLFGCSPEQLANYLVKNPEIYNAGVIFFNGIKGKNILFSELEKTLNSDIDLFKKAHCISMSSEWFAFSVYDSWSESNGNTKGVELYQKAGSELVIKLGLDSDGAPTEKEAIDFLKKKKIKIIYTLTPPPKGYCGVQYMETDKEDIVVRQSLEEYQLPEFKEKGIEIIFLKELYCQ